MDIQEKLKILSDAAKYDVSCSSSGSKRKISLKYIFYVYLSEINGCSNLIYNYIKLGFKLGNDLDLYVQDNRVLEIHKAVKKVTFGIHRLLGLVRFKSIENKFLYSPIEPDHNLIALITPHFAERLSNENFIIHDIKRRLASVYNKDEWSITPRCICQNVIGSSLRNFPNVSAFTFMYYTLF